MVFNKSLDSCKDTIGEATPSLEVLTSAIDSNTTGILQTGPIKETASVCTNTEPLQMSISEDLSTSPICADNSNASTSRNSLDSPLAFSSPNSSKSVQTLKVWSDKSPKKPILCQQLKVEKERQLKAEKLVIALSNQLAKYGSTESFIDLFEKHLSPSILTIVKTHISCKTKNPYD